MIILDDIELPGDNTVIYTSANSTTQKRTKETGEKKDTSRSVVRS